MNPVLRGELLRRWRGRRAFLVLVAFMVVLAGLMLGLHEIGRRALEAQARFNGGQAAFLRPALGRFMVESVLACLLGLVMVAAPGFAAGQIAGERERKTLPLLQATLMRPHEIVVGKLLAATAWVGLLVAAALPLVSISMFFGGVEPVDVLLGLATILYLGLALGAMAIGVSAVVRRTSTAVVTSYALVLGLVLGTGFAFGLLAIITERPVDMIGVLYLNPFLPLAGAVDAAVPSGVISLPTPLSPFAYALDPEVDARLGGVGDSLAWLSSYLLLGAVGLVGGLVATRRLGQLTDAGDGQPGPRRRRRRGVRPAPGQAEPADGRPVVTVDG